MTVEPQFSAAALYLRLGYFAVFVCPQDVWAAMVKETGQKDWYNLLDAVQHAMNTVWTPFMYANISVNFQQHLH